MLGIIILPEFGSAVSGDGDSYLLTFFLNVTDLFLLSDSIVVLFTVACTF